MTVVIILDSLLYNCPVVDSFLSFVFDWLWILYVSLQLLFNHWLFLLIAGLKLKDSVTKWQSAPQNSRDKSFFLRKLTGLMPQLWILDHILSCFVCSSLHLCLSFSVAQFHLVPLRPPSNFFILSTRPVQDTAPEGVLSLHVGALLLWHSLPQ
jgi:hypothetical protein